MPINLSKGQKVDLTKGNPGLKNIMVGLGWDVNAFDSGVDFDLDAAAFMLGADGKCPTDKEFVFYGNLAHPSESVKHMGDNLTGEGEGDDEQIQIDLSKVPANIERIAFTVTIYDADVRRQNFGQVSNAFIRIVYDATGKELIHFDGAAEIREEIAAANRNYDGIQHLKKRGDVFQWGGAWLCEGGVCPTADGRGNLIPVDLPENRQTEGRFLVSLRNFFTVSFVSTDERSVFQ